MRYKKGYISIKVHYNFVTYGVLLLTWEGIHCYNQDATRARGNMRLWI